MSLPSKEPKGSECSAIKFPKEALASIIRAVSGVGSKLSSQLESQYDLAISELNVSS